MAAKLKLTLSNIKKAAPGDVLKDEGSAESVPGLQLRVFEKGAAFYLYYRTSTGQQRKPKLGDLSSAFTIDHARRMARDWLLEVQRGGDPSAERKALRQEQPKERTIGDAYEACMAEYWSREQYQRSGWAKYVQQGWENHLREAFADKPLRSLTAPAIKQWRDTKFAPLAQKRATTGGKTTANKLVNILSRIYTFAAEKGWVDAGFNPCAAVEKLKDRKRSRFATADELGRIGRALDELETIHPVGVAFLRLMYLTGIRPRALERAVRDDFAKFTNPKDGRTYGVLVSAGKSSAETGEDEVVVFPPEAVEIVDRIPAAGDGRLIPCKMPKHVWRKVREMAGCPDLWARDSRRTFATVGLDADIPIDVIGRALNHHSQQTTLIYAKAMISKRAAVAAAVAERLAKMMGAAD